ncbi:unnamed protein product [Paramecium sonneborni]|uniref:Uncharacterized protein n=1 Tax=Paramecium sonneborni TaxID=65129 RepID=A0A8S1RUK5_9CILI|nr:unnamed protein product [Paramecium sonneborni]
MKFQILHKVQELQMDIYLKHYIASQMIIIKIQILMHYYQKSQTNTEHLVCNKYCLLESKSNLLRYILNTEIIILFLNQNKYPNLIVYLSIPKKNKPNQTKHSPKKCFDIKPKYFHSKSKTWLFNSKQYISRILTIKDRELYKLQALQTQHDEYSKYRSWSIQQQELKQQNKLKFDYQQKSSRQLRYSITTSTSPKQKSQTLSQTHKDQDYTIQIQRLKKEISQLESKLKHNN